MLKLPAGSSAFQKPFSFFCEISNIPRGSFHGKDIEKYLIDFAKSHSLSYEADAAGNVLIRKAASLGYETHKPIILQGHTDMVAVKRPDCQKDLEKDGLELKIDGDWLFAEGTSLGGDDGAAVAMMLAVLEDDTLPHPPIEALFTADEEVGLLGAHALNPFWLTGNALINMDSEEEGIFTLGCAGGVRCDCTLFGKKEKAKGKCFSVTLDGFLGGHSGVEIDKGRANAISELAKIVEKLEHFKLIAIRGGSADNVIPSSAFVTLICDDPTDFLEKQEKMLRTIYNNVENGIRLHIDAIPCPDMAFDENSSKEIIRFLAQTPFGPLAMSQSIEGLVETSQNLGVVKTDEASVTLTVSIRSSLTQEKEKLKAALQGRVAACHGHFDSRGDYPAWEYKEDSALRTLACQTFFELYGKKPICNVIHAGLECGIFAEKIKGLDAISFGPDMQNIHSYHERLSLSSAGRVYEFLLALLKRL